ncbi:iron uptake system protein EfeO [Glutamicibacter protophormiae]|uniref:iron uptake system protein EfeO n=1 Tax=Glutamicibacter protophormiae TaxID=37930 RepID=UPI002A803515|nr:iron uptake system protein EfeO [Glutamicibacter protophormiae]WPR66213.1 iron uptake system protein EfeO [Glutamicibacter protophormiae]WPR69709.1 iron uptake system protein EfeO [Glutamicibacter protophormiae]
MTKFLAPAALLALGALALTGCTDNNAAASADGSIAVTASDDACTLASATAAGGTLKFTVKNEGTKVNEFYLLAEDGLRIVGEVENIGPGVSRDLVVMAPEGSYFAACKPGMVGDGIRSPFTVTAAAAGQEVSADRAALQKTAVDQYAAYVKDQSQQLLAGTEDFAAAFAAGEEATAKELYPQVRMHWERIEPVAESFGDLDPILDAREADLEEGQEFTGWHRAEKDLWAPKGYTKMTQAQRQQIADGMVENTAELATRAQALEFTPDKLANGAKELLDEVATGKVTGEEEAFSHTDLWDFQANLEGAKIAYQDLAPLLKGTEDALDAELAQNFATLQEQLDAYRVGEGFKYYDQLSTAQVQELAAGVDALSEPLSRLTAAVVK